MASNSKSKKADKVVVLDRGSHWEISYGKHSWKILRLTDNPTYDIKKDFSKRSFYPSKDLKEESRAIASGITSGNIHVQSRIAIKQLHKHNGAASISGAAFALLFLFPALKIAHFQFNNMSAAGWVLLAVSTYIIFMFSIWGFFMGTRIFYRILADHKLGKSEEK